MSDFVLVIEPNCKTEIQDAIDYYDSVSSGLGYRFFETLNNYFSTLMYNPFFEKRYKDFRILPISKFPYVIFFKIDEVEKIVHIVSVFNTNQSTLKYPK